jgi:hypothetical protein
MKRAIIASTISAIIASSLSGIAFDDEGNASYWNREKRNAPSVYSPAYGTLTTNKSSIAQQIADGARSKLGPEWVASALKIGKIESGYTCNVRGPKTRHGRAVGPMQVLVPSAESLGISAWELNSSCTAQIEAGLRHMERCIKLGARTEAQMASCHVSGSPFKRNLVRKAERYRQKYIHMAANAQIPAWIGTLHHW